MKASRTPAIADRMNDRFINIKVDREERPDLDQIYQHAPRIDGEQGGWPLTMFLTPDGEPFWGGTYFPPEPCGGDRASPDPRTRSAAPIASDRERSPKNVAALARGAAAASADPKRGELDRARPARPDRRAAVARGRPASMAASALRRNFRRPGSSSCCGAPGSARGQTRYRDAVAQALDTSCQGGIYDHLGGGFARYSVDARWLVPHFEKMLYDNAELVESADPGLAGHARPALLSSGSRRSRLDHASRCSRRRAGSPQPRRRQRARRRQILCLVRSGDRRAARRERAAVVQALLRCRGARQLGRTHDPQSADAPALADTPRPSGSLARCRALAVLSSGAREFIRVWTIKVARFDWNGLMIASRSRMHGIVFERPAWIEMAQSAFDFDPHAHDCTRRASVTQLAGRSCPASRRCRRLCQSLSRRSCTHEATGDEDLAGSGAHCDGNPRPSLLGRSRRRLLFCCGRHRGIAHEAPRQPPIPPFPPGSGDSGRSSLPAGGADRRTGLSASRREWSSRRFRARLENHLSARHLPQQCRAVARTRCRSFSSANADLPHSKRFAPRRIRRFLPARIITCLSPGGSLPADHPAFGKGLVDGKARRLCLPRPGLFTPVTDAETLLESLARLR